MADSSSTSGYNTESPGVSSCSSPEEESGDFQILPSTLSNTIGVKTQKVPVNNAKQSINIKLPSEDFTHNIQRCIFFPLLVQIVNRPGMINGPKFYQVWHPCVCQKSSNKLWGCVHHRLSLQAQRLPQWISPRKKEAPMQRKVQSSSTPVESLSVKRNARRCSPPAATSHQHRSRVTAAHPAKERRASAVS